MIWRFVRRTIPVCSWTLITWSATLPSETRASGEAGRRHAVCALFRPRCGAVRGTRAAVALSSLTEVPSIVTTRTRPSAVVAATCLLTDPRRRYGARLELALGGRGLRERGLRERGSVQQESEGVKRERAHRQAS